MSLGQCEHRYLSPWLILANLGIAGKQRSTLYVCHRFRGKLNYGIYEFRFVVAGELTK